MVDTVVVQTAETNMDAPADHNQKMIEKAEGINSPDSGDNLQQQADRPAWLPEKFKSPEDMAKAYASLESKLGSQSNPPAAAPAAPPVETQQASEALSQQGLDMTAFTNEFDSTGELSEASYAKLASAGFDKNIVDNYIEGQRARASMYEVSLKESVGGVQAYSDMVEWAKASMTGPEIDAFNMSISSANTEAAKLAVAGLKSRYEAANGREPRLLQGSSSGGQGDSFQSRAEMTTAMKDPRYKTDTAYRQSVINRLARSNVL
jgi:hypothetical protein